MRSTATKLIGVNAMVFAVVLLALEGAAQILALVRPAYDVLSLEPDRAVGWTEAPNLRWTWAGPRWYASDYTVEVRSNSLGFRDLERDPAKPEAVARVALLGDSFVEAVQVPFEDTAGQSLERALNATSSRAAGDSARTRWEVLNFGISNFGVGQYLLTWEEYARRFSPDYVAIFVARFHMERSVRKYEFGTFPGTRDRALWVRPTFRLEGGELVREPARDFDEFVRVQRDLVANEFGGERSRRRHRLVTAHYAKEISLRLAALARRLRRPEEAPPDAAAAAALFDLNARIIETLGRDASRAGSRLVVVDASRYFDDDASTPAALEALCARNDIGYVPLYRDLQHANANGVATRWPHDYHFNRAGNDILAEALLDWLTKERVSNRTTRHSPPFRP